MSRLTHGLTVVIMLLHGILGCCWHHGHADACAADEPVASAPAVAHSCCGHHHAHVAVPEPGHEASDPSDESPAPHDESCHDQVCVYVGSRAPELSQPVLALPFLPAVVTVERNPSGQSDRNRFEAATPPYRSALETCARLQVWRI